MSLSIDEAWGPDAATIEMLKRHPRVRTTHQATDSVLTFRHGEHVRQVKPGLSPGELGGLAELADNNPWVCADTVSLPSPAGTLALIALGPLFEAGIVVEPPSFLTNVTETAEQIAADLQTVGWAHGVTLEAITQDMSGVVAATAIAAISTPADLSDIDNVFEERYERSFFVRRDESSVWDVALVKSQPYAVYRLRIAADEPTSLLTVQVMADRDGKCGAAQLVHAMNIMCGFEESLGIN